MAEHISLSPKEHPVYTAEDDEMPRSAGAEAADLETRRSGYGEHEEHANQAAVQKLDHKRLGSVKILEAIGKRAFRVELPSKAKNRPAFHVIVLYTSTRRRVLETEGKANYEV